jgi:Leucine-rich repeat (LRR) protein
VFRPSNTTFFFRHSNTQGVADESIFWGQSNWRPVAGRFNVTGGGGGGNPPPPPPGPFCSNVTGMTQGDCEALLTLYAATGGPGWTDAAGWAVTKTPCTWAGITCNGAGRVTSLILNAEPPNPGNLSGSLPAELGNLTGLMTLEITTHDNLTGEIPSTLGNLVNMRDFDLSGNALSGGIPSSLGNMTLVNVEIDLHNNLLTGGLPASFQNLTQLTTLDLGGNNLDDEASLSVLGDMTGLMFIDLRNNAFIGEVPGVIGSLPSLIFLDLSDENNIGQWNSLGSGFGDSGSLATLDMSGNNFTNSVFTELPSVSLTELDLSFNSLTGDVPDGITAISSLESLDLSGNAFNDMEVPNFTTMPGFIPTPPDVIAGELTLIPNTCIGTSNAANAALILAHNPSWVDCNPA